MTDRDPTFNWVCPDPHDATIVDVCFDTASQLCPPTPQNGMQRAEIAQRGIELVNRAESILRTMATQIIQSGEI
jgi:hypothetical protein